MTFIIKMTKDGIPRPKSTINNITRLLSLKW